MALKSASSRPVMQARAANSERAEICRNVPRSVILRRPRSIHGDVGPVKAQQVRKLLLSQLADPPVAEQDAPTFPLRPSGSALGSQEAAAITSLVPARRKSWYAARDVKTPDREATEPYWSLLSSIPSPYWPGCCSLPSRANHVATDRL